ncbi:hypothetical protein CKO_01482 [Citrobacter koseri ATCC BAA-895]|uniref:Uncharacterized protein n=1 Tax=Citrobacter koseri (strain ATCC BAA-895 / CDC 4225-83 / SGSC4696) TaxID=290338 RepID=A8AGK2_CITK8|nr:hypothetical protein CKO_01482 [Citrobacter koseri ATCC BAA-895]
MALRNIVSRIRRSPAIRQSSSHQNNENNNATGRLIGQVAPTRTALRKRIHFLSWERNQVIRQAIAAITA